MTASLLVYQASFLDLCPITAAAAALTRGGGADTLDLCVSIKHQAVAGKID